MGVEYYLVCDDCKEYIDLHKSYYFANVFGQGQSESNHPKFDAPDTGGIKDRLDSFWAARGIWFLSRHIGHKRVNLMSDHDDDCFERMPNLKEVVKYEP
jgi:hypothetical protein